MVCAHRLHQDFTVVSVLEKLEMGLEVLECLLPSYFKVLDGPKKKIFNSIDHFQGVVNLQAKISLHLNADNKSQTVPPTKEVHTFQSSSQYENINFKKSCPNIQVLSILEAALEPEQILYSSALTR